MNMSIKGMLCTLVVIVMLLTSSTLSLTNSAMIHPEWVSSSLIKNGYEDGELSISPLAVYVDNYGVYLFGNFLKGDQTLQTITYQDIFGKSQIWEIGNFKQGSPLKSDFIMIDNQIYFVYATVIDENPSLILFQFNNVEWSIKWIYSSQQQIVDWILMKNSIELIVRDNLNELYSLGIINGETKALGNLNLDDHWGSIYQINGSYLMGISILNETNRLVWFYDIINKEPLIDLFQNIQLTASTVAKTGVIIIENQGTYVFSSNNNNIDFFSLSDDFTKLIFAKNIKISSFRFNFYVVATEIRLILHIPTESKINLITLSFSLIEISSEMTLIEGIHPLETNYVVNLENLFLLVYSEGGYNSQNLRYLTKFGDALIVDELNLIEKESRNYLLITILSISTLLTITAISYYLKQRKRDD